MKWILKEITVGDMVRVPMGDSFHHYGICTGDDRIVQFGNPFIETNIPKENIRIMATDIATFLNGQFAEVAELDSREKKRRRSIKDTVGYAEGRIGESGYDILYNNCEHFANECVFGIHFSSQVDSVRQEVEAKMPPIFVYIAKTSDVEIEKKLPAFLKTELKKVSNERVANEKLAAYSLLKKAVDHAFGIDFTLCKCKKTKNGKPYHKDVCFSVSHAQGIVAVAVSKKDVGIDIEAEIAPDRADRLSERIRHEDETDDRDLTLLWTCKEAIFKLLGEKSFVPQSINTTKYRIKSARVCHDGVWYTTSIAAENVINVRFNSTFSPSVKIETI